MTTLSLILNKALTENRFSLSDEVKQKFIRYLELMKQWNQIFNLTTLLDPHDMVYLHIVDSLMVTPYLKGSRILDVGSGAGLPGIPLAIMHPEKQWVLLDKNNKKTRFLTQVAAELGLKNVTVVHSRSQDFHPEHCFDSILSRALGTIDMFIETTAHLLCPSGIFIAMKGKYPQSELDVLREDYKIEAITRIDIKGITVERHIVCLHKSER